MIFDVSLALAISVCGDWTLHRLGHLRHPLNAVHRVHALHHERYRGRRFLSSTYVGDYGALAYAPLIVIVWLATYATFPSHTTRCVVAFSGCFALASDYLHSHFHTAGSWLERFEWFARKRRYHFIHHRRNSKNLSLGGLSTPVDALMGTLSVAVAPPDSRSVIPCSF